MTHDKDYLAIFSASYERAFQLDDGKNKLIDRFYEIFFTKSPEIPQKTPIWVHKRQCCRTHFFIRSTSFF